MQVSSCKPRRGAPSPLRCHNGCPGQQKMHHCALAFQTRAWTMQHQGESKCCTAALEAINAIYMPHFGQRCEGRRVPYVGILLHSLLHAHGLLQLENLRALTRLLMARAFFNSSFKEIWKGRRSSRSAQPAWS